jgi:hypothetical protein
MQTIEGFDFFPLTFDEDGALTSRRDVDALLAHAAAGPVTDAIFLAHGFRNDEADASTLYRRFLQTFRANLARPEFHSVSSRRFVVAGLYWPSKPFREMYGMTSERTRSLQDPRDTIAALEAALDELREGASPAQKAKLTRAKALLPALAKDRKKQDRFVTLVLSVVDGSDGDATEGLPQIRAQRGSEVLARLSDGQPGLARGLGSVFNSIAGGVGTFLNLTKWYVMKERAGTVGATGVATTVRELRRRCPSIKVHLVGHSLGGRLMAGCVKALSERPAVRPDSLLLLEAAFSHFGFSPDNGRGKAGFFRNVIERRVVKGPFLSTFSALDSVVGKAYSIMSRLAFDNTREIGDADDEFGGIGRNGPLKTAEVHTTRLHKVGAVYDYKPDVINNLDGSGGLIKDHGDVTNDAITYAFASAVART